MSFETKDEILDSNIEKQPLNIDTMLKERSCERRNAEILHFSVEGDARRVTPPIIEGEKTETLIAGEVTTVYNPSKPVAPGIITARQEPLTSQVGNVSFFFEKDKANFVPANGLGKTFVNAQDPSFTPNIGGANIFTINKIETDDGKITSVREQLFKINENLDGLDQPFAEGPIGMKCIRLTAWPDGKIGIFTRPQGGEAGRGKIGYIEVDTLDEVQEAIPQAEILEGIFFDVDWGGVNDAINLGENYALAIIHIACFQSGTDIKDYYGLAAIFDRENKSFKGTQIIAAATDFPSTIKPKDKNLGSVIYPGGAVLHEDGWITLYGGVGDTATFRQDVNIQSILEYAK